MLERARDLATRIRRYGIGLFSSMSIARTCILKNNIQLFRLLQMKRQAMLHIEDRCENGLAFMLTDLASMVMHREVPVIKMAGEVISDVLSCRTVYRIQRESQFRITSTMLETTTSCIRQDAIFIGIGIVLVLMLHGSKRWRAVSLKKS